MSIAEKAPDDVLVSEHLSNHKSTGKKATSLLLSFVPWSIVAGLLWAGIFVKPSAQVETVVPPPIDKRDKIYGVSTIATDLIWLAGNYGKILRSDDGGSSWVRQITDTRKHLQDISAWDSQRAVAVGNGGIVLVTEDGGNSWSEIEVPKSEIANKLIRVHAYEGGEAWAVGEVGMILSTTDYGKTWRRMREEEDIIMNDLIKLGDRRIFVVGEYGRMFRSDDNGKTWQDFDTDSQSSLTAIDFRTRQHGVIVGLDGVILTTTDAGQSWRLTESKDSGNTEHLMDVQWSGDINRWISVGNKGKWMTFSSELNAYEAGNLSKTDLSSHTELALVQGGMIAVGANVGYLDFKTDEFTTLGNDRQ
ncbi:glycosyl hydrolase [Pseudomaricurvus alkylphenolicus]|uniref:WD40/YVTN/BNR-like repeat-containing protein n=1 Tax=Pseudomaricurvus alkylphenolicus TaxID=1306991 RepID=UPI00141D8C8C|nr:YCF48-related protein [Pseudomaricurvus alkylphenolicus]NIB44345.1 glycosyl hydrolase [Pseudomaricurvus alkylphenolicus]